MNRARSFFYVCLGILCIVSAYHLGARNAGAQNAATPEVVVATGTLGAYDLVPFPTYSDGTAAAASECRCIVSPRHIKILGYEPILTLVPDTESGGLRMKSLGPNVDPNDPSLASYMIVAIRSSIPTPTQGISIGQLKSRYAAPAGDR